jgi:hypothetical protein
VKRAVFTVAFLAVTAVALVMECWASWDGNAGTIPWTYLIVRYVPGEVFAFGFGGLVVWLTVHFALRYAHRRRFLDRTP